MRVILNIAVCSIAFISSSCLKNYYGVNGVCKLSFLDKNRFYFDSYNFGNDTGFYRIQRDTVFLSTVFQRVRFFEDTTKSIDDSSYINIRLRIYERDGILYNNSPKKGELVRDTIVKMDMNFRVYVENLFISYGQLLSFNFLGENRFFVKKDTLCNGYFEIDVLPIGKRACFQDYPLLMKNGYLLPFDERANTRFKNINDFEFLPMKKGTRNQKYKTHYSGVGIVH